MHVPYLQCWVCTWRAEKHSSPMWGYSRDPDPCPVGIACPYMLCITAINIWLSTFTHNTCFQPCMLVQWTQLGVDQKALYTRMLEVKRQNRGKWKGLGIDLYFQHEARTLLHTSCSKLDTNFSCYWLQYETGWHAVSSFVIQKLYSIWDFSTLSSCMMTNTYTGS